MLKVHFVNVGYGDCILIQQGNSNLLIDAAHRSHQDEVMGYLKKQKIKSLEYIVSTHPHPDHIGNLAKVISRYATSDTKLYMPKVSCDSKAYQEVLKAAKTLNMELIRAVSGTVFNLNQAKVEVLSPIREDYKILNNFSTILKVSYGRTRFLFTSDAEAEAEREVLKNNLDVRADLMQVGHHGGKTSSTWAFLSAVSPKCAVISVDRSDFIRWITKMKLTLQGIKTYDTYAQGDIVAVSDGVVISVM